MNREDLIKEAESFRYFGGGRFKTVNESCADFAIKIAEREAQEFHHFKVKYVFRMSNADKDMYINIMTGEKLTFEQLYAKYKLENERSR